MKYRTSSQLNALDTNAAIKAAYGSLGDHDRVLIDDVAALLYKVCHDRHTGKTPLGLGKAGTLEVLAKLGIWMLEE